MISSSLSRISGSPANTMSFTLTRTLLTMPMVGAATLMMPDGGSTRPGATASQRLSFCCADAAKIAGEPPLRLTATNAAIKERPKTSPGMTTITALRIDMFMPSHNSLRLPCRPAGFFAYDGAVLDMDDPVSVRHQPRIVGDHQNAAAGILGDF